MRMLKISNMSSIKRIFYYANGLKLYIVLSTIFSVIYSALSMIIPYIAGSTIDVIVSRDNVDFTYVNHNLLIIIFIVIIAFICQFIITNINNRISYGVINRIRIDAYGKISHLPISFIDKTTVGSVQSMIINDSETIGDGLLLFLNHFFSGIVAIITTLTIMIIINWKIAVFVIVFTPLSFFVSYLIASKSFISFKSQAEIRARQASYIDEISNNYKLIHLYNTGENTCSEFKTINNEYKEVATRASFLSSITNPSTRFINALIYAGVALIGSRSVINSVITVGALSSLLAYSSQYMKPFNDLSSVYTEMSDAFACLERIFSFIDEKEIEESLSTNFDKESLWDRRGDFKIEFRNVSFSYDGISQVLKDVSFVVEPGMSCAIVGPTGCGKTTLINLLLRFYEPDSGVILINDIPINEISRDLLRTYIGVVNQDTWFKNIDIMDNIKYGQLEDSDNIAIEAAKTSGADDFISRLPNKYHEIIDNKRQDISDGQRQLLSVTRAIVSDRSMLVLDEATSSVDILTEVKIQNAIKKLLCGRTSIIIAHRLSTIVDADRIIVLDSGCVAEIGNHEELIKNNGFYSKLYKSYTL